MSKGSKPRPLSVARDEYASAWERTFQRNLADEMREQVQRATAIEAEPNEAPDLTSTYLLGD